MKTLMLFVYMEALLHLYHGLYLGSLSGKENQNANEGKLGPHDAGRQGKRVFCGMKDWEDQSPSRNKRQKRFILRGVKWQKRALTWRLLNYSPYLRALETLFLLENAFKTWARHSNLIFRRIGYGRADITIKFAGVNHLLDQYSYCSMQFDGPGGDVAHAFYPFPGYDYAGDIHFDEREQFSSNGEFGINFAAAVLHEIGHSLGLMHTNTYSSVMNPDFILDVKGKSIGLQQDDIFAIQSLYGMPYQERPKVQRSILPVIPEHHRESIKLGHKKQAIRKEKAFTTTARATAEKSTANSKGTKTFPPTAYTQGRSKDMASSHPKIAFGLVYSSNVNLDNVTQQPSVTTSDPIKKIQTTVGTTTTFQNTNSISIPLSVKTSSCPTTFDAVYLSRMNSNTYVIHGDSVFSLGRSLNKVKKRMSAMKKFQFKSIDATYLRRKRNELVVFSGYKYAVYSNEASLKKLGSIYDLGIPLFVKKIDAAVVFGRFRNTYLFSGKFYWRFNEMKGKMDPGYPKKISAIWKGLPSDVDSAVTWRNGVTYFFKGSLYYRINGRTASVEAGYPKPIRNIWTKC